MDSRLLIGAMSGTSADGVDAALVRVSGPGKPLRAELVNLASHPFSGDLRHSIASIRSGAPVSLRTLAELTRGVSEAYLACIENLNKRTQLPIRQSIQAIAAHGQTLFHDPPLTMQVFDPAFLAQRSGIDVISDFRSADCAVGGQGAPLVPFADFVLFGSADEDRAIVNIGGISNVTLLPRGGSIDDVTGFDTGPGNCLSDWLLRDAGGIDLGGAQALAGRPVRAAVERFLQGDYVQRPAPKSTDGPAMIAAFEQALADIPTPLPDRLATAAEIVAQCILRQTPRDATLVVAGGGVHNQAIMQRLCEVRRVQLSDALGVPAQAREAMAFAILGAARLDGVPANLPRVTGARRRVVLGAWTKA